MATSIPIKAPLTPLESAAWNTMRDEVSANNDEIAKLKEPLTIAPISNHDPLSGGISKLGGILVSNAVGHGFHLGLVIPATVPTWRIASIRMRIDQLGADTCDVTLWEVLDDVGAGGAGTAIVTVNSGAGTGAQWVTLAAVNRPLVTGYMWYLRVDHQFVGGASIRYGVVEVTFEPVP